MEDAFPTNLTESYKNITVVAVAPPKSYCPSINNSMVFGRVRNDFPQNTPCVTNDQNWRENCEKPGTLIEIIKMLAKYFHCSVELDNSDRYGNFYSPVNKSFGGIIEKLVNQTVDITAVTMTFTSDRTAMAKPSLPHGTTMHYM